MKLTLPLLALGLVLAAPAFAKAQPTLDADCVAAGASLETGSNASAGKIDMGAYTQSGTCTVTFPTSHPRACNAVGTNGGGFGSPESGITPTLTTMVVGSQYGWSAGDVISYQCTNF
jgi:hypothetical protein